MTLEQQILSYAKQQEPHESCGFVVFSKGEQQFIACENIADQPEDFFEISPHDWLRVQQYDGVVAVVHSHPNGVAVLSAADRQMQCQSALDWWLVCRGKVHKFRYVPPLLGRVFKHRESDCYSLFRDGYMLSGIDFPTFDYQPDWYQHGENLYLENLKKYQFERILSHKDLQLGDLILMQIGSDIPNHVAIYLGDQYVLHHSPNRLSKRDLYDGYWLKHTHSIWRYKQWLQLDFTAILNDLESSSS